MLGGERELSQVGTNKKKYAKVGGEYWKQLLHANSTKKTKINRKRGFLERNKKYEVLRTPRDMNSSNLQIYFTWIVEDNSPMKTVYTLVGNVKKPKFGENVRVLNSFFSVCDGKKLTTQIYQFYGRLQKSWCPFGAIVWLNYSPNILQHFLRQSNRESWISPQQISKLRH